MLFVTGRPTRGDPDRRRRSTAISIVNPEPGHSTARRWRIAGWSLAALILLLPLIAMPFTAEVDWQIGDFLAAAVLLGAAGLALEWLLRRSTRPAYRAMVLVTVLGALVLTWAALAVG
jgi:hypothetical protein